MKAKTIAITFAGLGVALLPLHAVEDTPTPPTQNQEAPAAAKTVSTYVITYSGGG